ncbi:hypothetical protein [Halorientalis pallida]|uniref:Uncharacterized protein n=1 Tax=Halorientalis pallida TaxID=2479928 RepID=A0A498KVV9_9EURY|nr:hypothetical protein [Halorientalis pallida]RXK48658.1 hypothetical protein EAF64_13370 [Halorientalis pallida]
MCHGLAPGFILRDEIAEELLEEAREQAETETTTEETPSFATDDEPAGDAITGGATDRDRPTGGPK